MHRALAIAAVLAWAGPAFGESAFETGVDRFRAQDFAGSVAPLEQAHASDPRDADTALLLGIAHYRTDRGVRAVPLLQQAERSGDDDVRASARVFLGLIADERGDSDRAQSYFGLVARSSTDLGSTGRLLL